MLRLIAALLLVLTNTVGTAASDSGPRERSAIAVASRTVPTSTALPGTAAPDAGTPAVDVASTSAAGDGGSSHPSQTHVRSHPVHVASTRARANARTARPPSAQASPTPSTGPAETPADGDPVDADVALDAQRVATPAVALDGAQTVGVTWAGGADPTGLSPEVRVLRGGTWSAWQPLETEGDPDHGTADARHAARGGTEAQWVGDADALQLSVDASAASTVLDSLSLALVGSPDTSGTTTSTAGTVTPVSATSTGPSGLTVEDAVFHVTPAGTTATAGTTGSADGAVRTAADTNQPTVITRAQWGAPAQVCTPDVATGLVGAVVHHTADPNTYTTVAQAEAMIRNDAAYHISSRGWCDIGYNFVVDKWGNIYEGRAGSLTAPVIGVHAGGFNTGTVGVAMLGTYDSAPSAATQASVAHIIGWRLGAYRVDPRGTMSYHTGVGENSRFQNQTVTLPRVFGHRDVAYTACPGSGGYAALPAIRTMAWSAGQAAWANPPSRLLRTWDNATVYLLSNAVLHPIGDVATMSAYSALGPLTYAPQQYLAAWPVGARLGRAVSSPDGHVWFVDAGIRLSFTSCDQAADFALSCAGAIPLEAAQIAKLHNGGAMANLYRTTNGKAFYVSGGAKHEVADAASLAASGAPTRSVTLLETGIAAVPYGTPLTRPGLTLHSRTGAWTVLATSAGLVGVPDAFTSAPGLSTHQPVAQLDLASVARVTTVANLTSLVRDQEGAVWYVSPAGRAAVDDATVAGDATPTVPDAVLALVGQRPAATLPLFVKSPSTTTVYVVRTGQRVPVRSWPDLAVLTGGRTATILTDATAATALPLGAPYDPPGALARVTGNASVYVLDGDDARIPLTTFGISNELGLMRRLVIDSAQMAARTTRPAAMHIVVQCGTTRMIGLGGHVWTIPADLLDAYPSTGTTLEAATCAALPRASGTLGRFLRQANGTIYWMDAGVKHPIRSWGTYLSLGGTNGGWISISDFAAGQIPTGTTV